MNWARAAVGRRPKVSGVEVLEEILVQPLDIDALDHAAADTETDHQRCELFAIDQHDSAAQLLSRLAGRLAEGASRDEEALACFLQVKAAGKLADRGGADVVAGGIPLRLNEHAVEAERIFIDHTVHAVIARAPQRTGCFAARTAVTHRKKQLDDQRLEGRR